jgi:hypothetical protein
MSVDKLRHLFKMIVRPLYWMCYWAFHGITSPLRLKPEYLIIGAQKAGTTSLFKYLTNHPNVAMVNPKEIHYYTINFSKGELWYRMHFPTAAYRWIYKQLKGQHLLSGESTPYYLFHPHVPKRAAKDIPNAKLIILLRNPVDRAYSHYKHTVRNHPERETLSFPDAIEQEDERTKAYVERLRTDETDPGDLLGHINYKARGHYAEQIARWLEYFERSQMLVLSSEKFLQNTHGEYLRVLNFLDLPEQVPDNLPKHHEGGYADSMDTKTRAYLKEYFKPYNQELYAMLGIDFGWES